MHGTNDPLRPIQRQISYILGDFERRFAEFRQSFLRLYRCHARIVPQRTAARNIAAHSQRAAARLPSRAQLAMLIDYIGRILRAERRSPL